MIEGMDKKPMQLQRMLLMLAPMPIDETIGKFRKNQWCDYYE